MEAYTGTSNKRAAIHIRSSANPLALPKNDELVAANAGTKPAKPKSLNELVKQMEKENVTPNGQNSRTSTRAEALSIATEAIKGAEDMTRYLSQVTAGTTSGRASRVASVQQKDTLSKMLNDVQARRGSLPLRISSCKDVYKTSNESSSSLHSQQGYTGLVQQQARERATRSGTSVDVDTSAQSRRPSSTGQKGAESCASPAQTSANTLRSVCVQQELEQIALTPERSTTEVALDEATTRRLQDAAHECSSLTDMDEVKLPSQADLDRRRARVSSGTSVVPRVVKVGVAGSFMVMLFRFTLMMLLLAFYVLPSSNGIGFHAVPI
ncbi:hypothetical protein FVE85_4271 [Porphyridium purpureum]|uniref:Uncharacterized protein n=1 Tax=Porphyridium purpureum TaxID=35688 RepID=A0A5J4YSI9_PORPP|nr:hypothetical protein FVE85_4271 [Porphyridium purpureum]|eukprot:POR1144..scf229_5